MFLSDEEIQALTGRKRITLQREWLTLRGWLHEVNAAAARLYCAPTLRAGFLARRPVQSPMPPNNPTLQH